MSTETEVALEKPGSPLAKAVPESANSGLPTPKSDYGAGDFWKEDGAPVKTVEKPPVTAAEPVKTEEKPVEVTSLASKWAAKVKVKAPAADIPPKGAEPVKKEEAVTAPDNSEDKLELDQRSSPVARENFAKLKTISKQYKELASNREKEITELRTKFETLSKAAPATATDNTELDKIKAENKRLNDLVLVRDTENSPIFQAQYVKPRLEALEAANDLLKAHGKEADLNALISKPRGELGKAVTELLKDVPAFDQTEISAQIQRAYQLRQQEQAQLKNASEVNGAIRQQNSQRDTLAFANVWQKHAPKLNEMIQTFDVPPSVKLTAEQQGKVEEYNQAVKSLETQARQIATGAATYESIADASIKAAAYDLHVNHILPKMQAEIGAEFSQMQDTIAQLTQELEGYRSRNPNKGIRANTTTASAGASTKPKTIEEAAAEAWGK